jgi:hypothetical protein
VAPRHPQLRAESKISDALQPGAAGSITMGSTNKTKLRRTAEGRKGAVLAKGTTVAAGDAKSMADQLRDILFKNSVRFARRHAAQWHVDTLYVRRART